MTREEESRKYCAFVQNDSHGYIYMEGRNGIRQIKQVMLTPVPNATFWMREIISKENNCILIEESTMCYIYTDEDKAKEATTNKICVFNGKIASDGLHVNEFQVLSLEQPMGIFNSIIETRMQFLKSAEVVFGSRMAAEVVLLSLISTAENETGRLNINLFGIGKDTVHMEEIHRYIRGVVPFVAIARYNIDSIHKEQFYSKLDDEEPGKKGIFQVCENTTILLDEREMRAGEIKNTNNLMAVMKMMESSEAMFVDDIGGTFYIPVKTRTIVISDTRSVLKADAFLCLDSSSMKSVGDIPHQVRGYIQTCQKYTLSMSSELCDLLINDYMKERKEADYKVEDFKADMNIMRLLCLSYTSNGSMDLWERAKNIGRKTRK